MDITGSKDTPQVLIKQAFRVNKMPPVPNYSCLTVSCRGVGSGLKPALLVERWKLKMKYVSDPENGTPYMQSIFNIYYLLFNIPARQKRRLRLLHFTFQSSLCRIL